MGCLSGEREKAERGEAGVERVEGCCCWPRRRRGEGSSAEGRDWALVLVVVVGPAAVEPGMGMGVEAREDGRCMGCGCC